MNRLGPPGAAIVCLAITLSSFSLQSCTSSGAMRSDTAMAADDKTTEKYETAQKLFAKIDLAEAAYQQARWQEATQLYQVVLLQIPDDPYLWFRLGNSLTQQGDYDNAIRAFETSIQQDARQAKPWFNLSTAHLLSAQLASLKAWQAMDPEDPSRHAAQERLDGVTQLLR